MSYCRWGSGSDVYVYPTGEEIVCCACNLLNAGVESIEDFGQEFTTKSRKAMIKHLDAHVDAGQNVPAYAFERLLKELNEEGDKM